MDFDKTSFIFVSDYSLLFLLQNYLYIMKKYFHSISICVLLILVTTFRDLRAQFTEGVAAETNVSAAPVDAVNTGSDILDFNGSTYEVSVWDDNNQTSSGLFYKVGNFQGRLYFTQTSFVTDPDVCLVNFGTSVFAIAVYYVSGGADTYYWEYFLWDNANNTFQFQAAASFATGVFGNTLNLDGNNTGNFAFIWDNPSQNVKVITGSVDAASASLHFSGNAITIATGSYPDLAMFRNALENQVDVVYIGTNGRIKLDFHRLSDLMIGSNSPTSLYTSPQANFTYYYPRIACPNSIGSNPEDWTIVAEDNDGSSSYYIIGINNNDAFTGQNVVIYNNGTSANSPYNTSDVPNLKPVVSYDKSYKVWIGWALDNSTGILGAPTAKIAMSPVALICDRRANVYFNQDYLYVPSSVINGTSFSSLSLSGRYSDKALFTYYNNQFTDVFTKTIDHSPMPSALKPGIHNTVSDLFGQLQQTLNAEHMDLESSLLSLRFYDANGRFIDLISGNFLKLREKWMDRQMTTTPLKTGIYFVSINSSCNRIYLSGKLFYPGSD